MHSIIFADTPQHEKSMNLKIKKKLSFQKTCIEPEIKIIIKIERTGKTVTDRLMDYGKNNKY